MENIFWQPLASCYRERSVLAAKSMRRATRTSAFKGTFPSFRSLQCFLAILCIFSVPQVFSLSEHITTRSCYLLSTQDWSNSLFRWRWLPQHVEKDCATVCLLPKDARFNYLLVARYQKTPLDLSLLNRRRNNT